MSTGTSDEQPKIIEELEEVAHLVCEYWVKEHRPSPGFDHERDREFDDRTLSIVVRDADGEMIGETQLWGYPGLYALVRVTDIPDTLPEYEDPPEKPGDHEWVYRDDPLSHHVKGIRCTQCGASESTQFPKMPKSVARTKPWKWIRHRPGCSHATERNITYWAGKRMADVLRNRPSPSRMTIGALWDEAEWMRDLWKSDHDGTLTDALDHRFGQVERVLEDRLQPRYPACPHCGENDWRIAPEDYPEECRNCYEYRADRAVEEAYYKQRRRLWGWRGHCHRSRGGDTDE